jgi:hypothetical protein
MDELLDFITRRRAPWAVASATPTGYPCKSGRHSWQTITDASMCCNGYFLRIAMPGERIAMVTSRQVKTGNNVGHEVQRLTWQKLEELPEDDPARVAMAPTAAVII